MGNICRNTEKEQNQYSMRALVNDPVFDGMSIYFTTESLFRIDNECLLIFTDAKAKIRKNPYLKSASKQSAILIEQHVESHLDGRTLKPGECVVVTISMTQFSFNKVAVLCLGVWGGSSHITKPLETCLQNCFDEINKSNINSLIITEYNEEFGIPVHIGEKCLIKSLHEKRANFKVVTFLCEKIDHQNERLASIEKFKNTLTFTSSATDRQSAYF